MPFAEWEPGYSVGYAAMDAQHRKLLGLLNALHDALLGGSAGAILDQTLRELVDYTQTHFAAEEALMRQLDFGGLEEHKVQHAQITRRLLELEGQEHLGSGVQGAKALALLKEWLTTHILQQDALYAAAQRRSA